MQETRVRSLGWEDTLEKENGNSLQYSCLKNLINNGLWQATVQGVTNSWTRLSDCTHTHMHTLLSIVVISIYIPTDSVRGCPFLHILSSHHLLFVDFFDDGRSDWCDVTPHGSFDVHFSDNE